MNAGQVALRVGAFVVAVGMVLAALVIRGGDDPSGPAGGPDGTDAPVEVADPGSITCARELGICDRLADELPDIDVQVEDGVVTARRLQAADAGEVWVTTRHLVAMVEDGRDRQGRGQMFPGDPEVAASSPLVLVGWADRLQALDDACGQTWACIGQVAAGTWADASGDGSWGTPKPAFQAPDRSGIGLLVMAQAAASQLDGDQLSARNLDAGPFQTWLSDLVRAVPDFAPPSGSQLVEMVQFGPSSRDVVGTTAAEATFVMALAGGRAADLRVVAGTPTVAAEAVIAAPQAGSVPDGLAAAVREALVVDGWLGPGDAGDPIDLPAEPSGGEVDPTNGGALEAVLLRWEQAR